MKKKDKIEKYKNKLYKLFNILESISSSMERVLED